MVQENSHSSIESSFAKRESRKAKNKMRKEQLDGAYGNYFRHWKTVEDCLNDYEQGKYIGNLWLSQSEKPYGPVVFDISPKDLEREYKKFIDKGINPKYVTIAQYPSVDWITLNAEVQLTPQGLVVYYSKEKAPHRTAFEKNTKKLTGLKAKLLLQRHMDPASYDGAIELLNKYPTDVSYSYVLEVHCFNRNLGTIPERNTIIGEVRNY